MTVGERWQAFVAWLRRGGNDRRQTATDLQLRTSMAETARVADQLGQVARRHRPPRIEEMAGERRP